MAAPAPWETVVLGAALVSVFAERLAPGGTSISRILAPALVVAAAIGLLKHGYRRTAAAPLLFALAYGGWALLSGFWTTSPGGTARLLGSLAVALSYTAAFVVLLSDSGQLRSLLGVVAVVASLTAAVEVVGYVLHPGTRGGAGVGDPNFVAAYLLVALPLVVVLASEARSAGGRHAARWATLLIVLGILSTLSRGGLVALAALLVVALLLPAHALFSSRDDKRRALIAAAGVVAVVLIAGGAGAARFETLYHNTGTGAGRENTWRAAWREAEARPLFGLGYGAFQPQSNDLMRETPGVDLRDFELRQDGSEAHSAYLGSAAELGFPGLALAAALLLATAGTLAVTALRARREPEGRLVMRVAFALVTGLVAWAVASIFLSTETSRPLWIVVGIAAALPRLLPPSRP